MNKRPALVLGLILQMVIVASLAFGQQRDWLQYAPAVVTVSFPSGHGSGVLIGQQDGAGYVATCRHVAALSPAISIGWYDGHWGIGRVIAVSAQSDVALIRTSPPPAGIEHVCLGAVTDWPKQGSTVHMFGHGGRDGRLMHWSDSVQGYVRGSEPDLIVLPPSAIPGDSGGPIVQNGKVVGLVSQGGGATLGPNVVALQRLVHLAAPQVLVACSGGT